MVHPRCITLLSGAHPLAFGPDNARHSALQPAKSGFPGQVIKLAHALHRLRQSEFRGPWYRQAGESPSLFAVTYASHAVRHSPLDELGATGFGGLGTGRPGNPPLYSTRHTRHMPRHSSLDEHGATRFGDLGTGRPGNPPLYSGRSVSCTRQRPSTSLPRHSPLSGRGDTSTSNRSRPSRSMRQFTSPSGSFNCPSRTRP